jgi:hypothetical protein
MKSKNELFETMKSNGYSIEQYKKDVKFLKREIKWLSAHIKFWETNPDDLTFIPFFENIDSAKEGLHNYTTSLEWATEYKNIYLTK